MDGHDARLSIGSRGVSEPSLRDIADKVDDLARLLARQAAASSARPAIPEPGPDVALLVDLHALRSDALTCAATAASAPDAEAFEALAAGLERVLAGRGGLVVTPRPGDVFDAATMDAAEITTTDDAALDRTVAATLADGLRTGERCVRPARVQVHRAG
ncbi:MAG: nucleotide exchange factor GrpE [Pseudonocardia sp. SCN 73-27]|nr:MAG: nucleotide exchange factor GrpE [Pseudonocardia sp. SCN 72-51]ODV00399.1 MAG: nucleotide exchange factor GrpE [Pseudonocardia sp. SCN 73-27]